MSTWGVTIVAEVEEPQSTPITFAIAQPGERTVVVLTIAQVVATGTKSLPLVDVTICVHCGGGEGTVLVLTTLQVIAGVTNGTPMVEVTV